MLKYAHSPFSPSTTAEMITVAIFSRHISAHGPLIRRLDNGKAIVRAAQGPVSGCEIAPRRHGVSA